MINKNKILKAINEGIQTGFKISSNKVDDSAYIDFNDSKVNNVESFSMGKLEQDFVDLGLSVKWAKCNIGATCQDTSKSWYGNYYAWGELEPKPVCTEDTYDQALYEKYNKDAFHVLQPEDDIVTQTYYGIDKFRMPTKEEIKELLDETKIKNEWKTDYQEIVGLNGREFTSLINGNSIFIPAAGYVSSKPFSTGVECYLRSNCLNPELLSCTYEIYFKRYDIYSTNYFYNYIGASIRGVCTL